MCVGLFLFCLECHMFRFYDKLTYVNMLLFVSDIYPYRIEDSV